MSLNFRKVSALALSATMLVATPAIASAQAPSASATATATKNSIGIKLVDKPSNATDPRADAYIVDSVKPGAEIKRKIQVTNDSTEAKDVKIYPGASSIVNDQWTPLEVGAENEITKWTTVTPSSQSLAPGQSIEPEVTIKVPTDVDTKEYYGVIWAEISTGASAKPDGSSVNTASRVGIRVYLDVDNGNTKTDFEIQGLSATNENGQKFVTAKIKNTGTRALDMSGNLKLTGGPGGMTLDVPAKVGTTVPVGGEADIKVPVDPQTPNGPWQAHLTMKANSVEKAADGEITFPAEGTTNIDAKESDGSMWKWLAAIGGLVLLGIIGLLAWQLMKNKKANGTGAASKKVDAEKGTSSDKGLALERETTSSKDSVSEKSDSATSNSLAEDSTSDKSDASEKEMSSDKDSAPEEETTSEKKKTSGKSTDTENLKLNKDTKD